MWNIIGKFNFDGCLVFYSGGENSSKNGVALVLNHKFENKVLYSYAVNDQSLVVKVSSKPVNLVIIQVYFSMQ